VEGRVRLRTGGPKLLELRDEEVGCPDEGGHERGEVSDDRTRATGLAVAGEGGGPGVVVKSPQAVCESIGHPIGPGGCSDRDKAPGGHYQAPKDGRPGRPGSRGADHIAKTKTKTGGLRCLL
jgi:hypothetical protein